MNKKEARGYLNREIEYASFVSHGEFFDWLYDNGYEIIKTDPPKSKFMEEWGKVGIKPSEYFDGVGIWKAMRELVLLIDKHKADKEG